ncbi:MAG: lipocalin family protein [Candidatus Krumholzibacteria bacterium]|nr:lipocalin family protein [Candidatus Krumholzibacteria bacterium]
MPRRFIFHCLIILSLVLAGCVNQHKQAPVLSPDLIGVWLHPIAGLPGVEGYQFESDGSVRFVNMFTIEGVRWEMVAEDTVRIWSATERYPEPESVDLEVLSVTSSELRLRRAEAAEAVAQVSTREEKPWVGRWTAANGDFVDVAATNDGWQVSARLQGQMRIAPGRRVGEDLLIGMGRNTSRLKRSGRHCVQWADHGEFCRNLEDD